MTNGEKIKEIFPNAEIDKGKDGNDIWIAIDCWTTFTKEWWNAEYKEPITKNDLGVDCISRADAIHAVSEALERTFVENEDIAKMIINKLPSVTPKEPKTGHWIANTPQYDMFNPQYICSECGNAHTRTTPYCEMCGAKMVEP